MSEESYPGELDELRAIVMLVREDERRRFQTFQRIDGWIEKLSGEEKDARAENCQNCKELETALERKFFDGLDAMYWIARDCVSGTDQFVWQDKVLAALESRWRDVKKKEQRSNEETDP